MLVTDVTSHAAFKGQQKQNLPILDLVQPSDQRENPSSVTQLLEKNGVMEGLVCALTFIAYLGTLTFGFVYDDKPVIVDNPAIRSWHDVVHSLIPGASNRVAGFPGATFYRPVTALWTRLNYAAFGLNPAGWHFAMLAGNVLMTYLVFAAVKRLTGNRNTAAVAAILFGLHPVHVENVAWLSSVNDLLMSLLLLGSFLAYLKFREGAKLWMVASIVLFGLGLLSKETAAVFPLLILAFAIIFAQSRSSGNAGLWAAVKEGFVSIPYFVVLAAYLAFRRSMLHGLPTPIAPLSWTTMILTWPSVMWFDLKHLLLPISSSEFYSLAYVTAPGFENFLLPVLFLLIAGIAAWYGISKLSNPRLGAFAVVWLVLPVLPCLYLRAIALDNFVHDRFLYLPSVGIVILIALAIHGISAARVFGAKGVRAEWAIVAILGAAGLVGTVNHQLQWASNLLLYQNGVASAPQNLVVEDNLANEFANVGRYDRAIPIYLDVLQRNPRFWSSNYNLGYAYFRLGGFAEAESYLSRAIQIDDRDPDQFMLLARVQMQQGKLAQAAQNAERAVQRGPQNQGFHFVLAKILEESGKREQAISEYKTEVLYHPESAIARTELQKLLLPQ